MTEHDDRIRFLCRRDGSTPTRRWVSQTLSIYRQAVHNPKSHASLPHYRPAFERSIAAFEHWLAGPAAHDPE